jgi:O-antigen ligase
LAEAPSVRAFLALGDVRWTLARVGFLLYFLATSTYFLDVGALGMIVGLFGLAFGRDRPEWPSATKLFAALIVWSAVCTFASPYPIQTDRLLTFVKVGLAFLLAMSVLKDRHWCRFFMLVYFVAFILFPVRGTLFNYALYHNTLFGRAAWRDAYANPNDMAALSILGFSIIGCYLHTAIPRTLRLAAVIGAVLTVTAVLLTQSRAGLIGFAAASLLTFLDWRTTALRKSLILIVAIVALVVAVPSALLQRMETLGSGVASGSASAMDTEGSAAQRLEIWNTGMRVIADRPILGVGVGGYSLANAAYSPALGARDAHSTYVTFLAETGIPGLLLFCALFINVLTTVRRSRANARLQHGTLEWHQLTFTACGMVGYLVSAAWGSYGTEPVFTYLFAAIVLAKARELDQAVATAVTNRARD